MTAVEKAKEMHRVGEIAHRLRPARQRARADVRMRAGDAAGDQRIEQFGGATRRRFGLGRLAQSSILAVAGGPAPKPMEWQRSVIGQRRKRRVYKGEGL